MPGLNINISANVNNAVQGLQNVQKQLAQTAAASNAMGGSFANNVKGINQAGFALTNLGRVAQDAPFGFIAIQNNLSPLLESFQRLQKETGGVGGTFKALGASLIGAGGVGLALSVVSSILVKFPDLFSSLTKEEIAARDALKAYNEEVGKEQGSLQTELTRISSLVQIARDYSESATARTAAIKELQKEYPGYLGNINQENINSQGTTRAIDNLTAALTRKAKVQAITNLLTKAEEDLYKAQNSSVNDNLSAFEKIAIAVKNFGSLGSGAMDAVDKAAKNQTKSITTLQGNIDNLSSQLDALTRGQAENNDFELLNPEKLKKTKEKVDQIAETLRKLAIDRDEVSRNPLLSFDEKDQRTFDLINSAINRLRDLKLSNSSPIIVKLRAELDEAAAQVELDKFRERLKKTGVGDVVQIPVEISTTLRKDSGLVDIVTKNLADLSKLKLPHSLSAKVAQSVFDPEKFKDATERAKNYIKDTTDFVKGTIDPIFSAVFDNIGKGSQTAMQAVGDAIKGIITQLIRAAAEAAVLSLILNAIFPGSGGKFSFGAMFSQLSGIPKFAQGGIAYGPTVGLFGEAGPEAVVPLDKLPGIIAKAGVGNNSNNGVLTAEIRGSNIFLSNERTKTSRRRIYGK